MLTCSTFRYTILLHIQGYYEVIYLFSTGRILLVPRDFYHKPMKICRLPGSAVINKQEICGRRGEEDKEKGPGDLFPSEPTDEGTCAEETLNRGSRDSSAQKIRQPPLGDCLIFLMRKAGLEPARSQ